MKYKYIRTEDYGVCKITKEDEHTLSYENSYVCGCLWKDDYKGKIQYADTIEKLCDEFVIVAEDNNKPFIYDLLQPINSPEFDNKEETVYGAIWTEKGLIYVAKMNEKGELELL